MLSKRNLHYPATLKIISDGKSVLCKTPGEAEMFLQELQLLPEWRTASVLFKVVYCKKVLVVADDVCLPAVAYSGLICLHLEGLNYMEITFFFFFQYQIIDTVFFFSDSLLSIGPA